MAGIVAALVEWFAIISMALVGIEYAPAAGCEVDTMTEYRETAYLFTTEDGFETISLLSNAEDCLSASIDQDASEMPVFLETPIIYDS